MSSRSHVIWIQIEQANREHESWHRVLKRYYEEILELQSLCAVHRGKSKFWATIKSVSTHDRIKILNLDTNKEYWISPYFIKKIIHNNDGGERK